jgi:hypothetical protein
VHFGLPRRLDARNAAGEAIVRQRVKAVAGRAIAVTGDTLVLRITRWQGTDFWNYERQPLVARLVTSDACTEVGTRRHSARRTGAAFAAAPLIAYVVLYILCHSGEHPCLH